MIISENPRAIFGRSEDDARRSLHGEYRNDLPDID